MHDEFRTLEATAESAGGSAPMPALRVAPSPHIADPSLTTARMMIDVLIGLAPVIAMSVWVFRWYAVLQIVIATLSCLAAEALATSMRRRALTLGDFSAAVTGVILGLSLPWSAPWYVGVIAGFIAIGLGKAVFGGLGYNVFNPAMVGRAFVMIAFPGALGAAAYQAQGVALHVVTEATPLTLAKQSAIATDWWPLFLGTVNGSLGETSALACLLGGLWLCLRRTASWEIPASIVGTVAVLAGIGQLVRPDSPMTLAHHLLGGALLFGAFFIATDPVTSPLTFRGKVVFGIGIGVLVWLIRTFSGYPEGVMFAVLVMNAVTPLLNRWVYPDPLGGPAPAPKS
ncbi:MAG: RnfABCDGE type electron transport complex subunit D [Acidobacteriota bacterium]